MHSIRLTETFHFLPFVPTLGEMFKRIFGKHNTDTCFRLVRPLGTFLNSGKYLTRGHLVSGVYKIPCSCGKFYIVRAHQKVIERFIEYRNSIEKPYN